MHDATSEIVAVLQFPAMNIYRGCATVGLLIEPGGYRYGQRTMEHRRGNNRHL
jgi:hypothetical protein